MCWVGKQLSLTKNHPFCFILICNWCIFCYWPLWFYSLWLLYYFLHYNQVIFSTSFHMKCCNKIWWLLVFYIVSSIIILEWVPVLLSICDISLNTFVTCWDMFKSLYSIRSSNDQHIPCLFLFASISMTGPSI